MKILLTSEEARNLAVTAQRLKKTENPPSDSDSLADLIQHLGYVQIDTISVIQRAHHHTLWTRHEQYQPVQLDVLQSSEKKIFEYWGHAMSYLPITDYRYYLPRMKNFQNPKHKWIKTRYEETKHLFPDILKRIWEEGPLSSKDFIHPADKKGGTWWDWKPAKQALELLFWQGELMVSKRKNFQKVYDLRERVLPGEIDTSLPDQDEVAVFLVRKAIRSMGIATQKEIHRFLQPDTARDSDWQAVDREVVSKALFELVENGEIVPVGITRLPSEKYYVFKSATTNPVRDLNPDQDVYFLSPFDNLIIQRDRVRKLFEYDYTLECYVPAPKRKFGYFVLPILQGNKLIGRLDPKADRKSKTMIINGLQFEPTFEPNERFRNNFVETMTRFIHFNNCNKAEIINSVCNSFVKSIMKDVAAALQAE